MNNLISNKNSKLVEFKIVEEKDLILHIKVNNYYIKDNCLYYLEDCIFNGTINIFNYKLYDINNVIIIFFVKIYNKSYKLFIEQNNIYDNKKLKEYLAKSNIIISDYKKLNKLIFYLKELMKKSLENSKTIKIYENYGFFEENNNLNFKLGNFIFSKNHVFKNEENNKILEKYNYFLNSKGSLNKYMKIFDYLKNNNLIEQQFLMLIPFASVLLYFTNIHGFWFHIEGSTGNGKTTSLQMINSVFGHPLFYMCSAKDTELSINERCTRFKNLHISIDETTNLKNNVLSDLLLFLTQGQNKSRLNNKYIEIKSNIISNLFVVSTANNSIIEQISRFKKNIEAESMRIIEINSEIKKTNLIDFERNVFDIIKENYGVAGQYYLYHLLSLYDKKQIKEIIDNNKLKIIKILNLNNNAQINRLRYYITSFAVIISAFNFLKEFKILNIEIDIIIDYVKLIFNHNINGIEEYVVTPYDILSDIVNNNIDKTIYFEANEKNNLIYIKNNNFKNRICIRIEKYNNYINYIISKNFIKEFCKKNNYTSNYLYKILRKKYEIKSTIKILSKSSDYNSEVRENCISITSFKQDVNIIKNVKNNLN